MYCMQNAHQKTNRNDAAAALDHIRKQAIAEE